MTLALIVTGAAVFFALLRISYGLQRLVALTSAMLAINASAVEYGGETTLEKQMEALAKNLRGE